MQKIQSIKNSWAWNHKHHVITMSLAVALVLQVYIVEVMAVGDKVAAILTYSATAQNAQACDIKCEQAAWVESRAQEILKENQASYEREAHYTALIELNELTLEVAGRYTHAIETNNY